MMMLSSKAFFLSLFFLLVLAHDYDTFIISARSSPCNFSQQQAGDSMDGKALIWLDQLTHPWNYDSNASDLPPSLFNKSAFSLTSEDFSFSFSLNISSSNAEQEEGGSAAAAALIIVSEQVDDLSELSSVQIILYIEITSPPQEGPARKVCGFSTQYPCPPINSNPAPELAAVVVSLHYDRFKLMVQVDAVTTRVIPFTVLDALLAPQILYVGFIADKEATIAIVDQWLGNEPAAAGSGGWNCSILSNTGINNNDQPSERATAVFWVILGAIIALAMLLTLAAIFLCIFKKRRRRRPYLQATRPPMNFQPQPLQRAKASQESSATPMQVMSAPSVNLDIDQKASEVSVVVPSWLSKPDPR